MGLGEEINIILVERGVCRGGSNQMITFKSWEGVKRGPRPGNKQGVTLSMRERGLQKDCFQKAQKLIMRYLNNI